MNIGAKTENQHKIIDITQNYLCAKKFVTTLLVITRVTSNFSLPYPTLLGFEKALLVIAWLWGMFTLIDSVPNLDNTAVLFGSSNFLFQWKYRYVDEIPGVHQPPCNAGHHSFEMGTWAAIDKELRIWGEARRRGGLLLKLRIFVAYFPKVSATYKIWYSSIKLEWSQQRQFKSIHFFMKVALCSNFNFFGGHVKC